MTNHLLIGVCLLGVVMLAADAAHPPVASEEERQAYPTQVPVRHVPGNIVVDPTVNVPYYEEDGAATHQGQQNPPQGSVKKGPYRIYFPQSLPPTSPHAEAQA